MENIDAFLSLFKLKQIKKFSKKKKRYYNIPCTFDIETTSAYMDLETRQIIKAVDVVKMKENDEHFNNERYEKLAWMYVWQCSIDDNLFMGRTWEEFTQFKIALINKFHLDDTQFLIIYVRNLEFEFQFIKHYFEWENIFASKPHAVIYARSVDGFEFRCSYFLSGCSLETTGKNLIKYKATKQTGKLDYNLIRNSKTPLTQDEIDYCLYDVIVDSNFIRESMENEPHESLLKMPLTKTGYVRRYVKNHVMTAKMHKIYLKKTHEFTMDMKKYEQLKRAFMGGFTHSNALNTGITFNDVHSQDFTSSYPACLLFEKYPMHKGRRYKPKSYQDFLNYCKTYCCIFDIQFINIKMRPDVYENIISSSKCWDMQNEVENNGRIVRADKLTTTLTEIDFENIRQFYTFESVTVSNMWIYRKDYLPRELLECVLHFYKGKTELKDIEGKEVEYQLLKAMLNSIFGMMVTDAVKPTIELINDIWNVSFDDIEKALESYNTRYDRFLVYEWGLYCTAYARRNIFTGIKELKSDYIYADTDSLKYTNHENHIKYFDAYNNLVLKKIENVCKHYDFNFEDFAPKDKHGIEHIIGQYTYEGKYIRFKTLGAKRYMIENEKGINITVSGLNKKKAVPFLLEESKKKHVDVFELFNDELFVSGEYTGKLLHSYIDNRKEFDVIDYMGNKQHVICMSSVHLEPSSYSLSLAEQYKRYIEGVKTQYKKGD